MTLNINMITSVKKTSEAQLKKQREYYSKNKHIWSKKILCKICNKKVGLASLSKHRKSLKHFLKMNNIKFEKS